MDRIGEMTAFARVVETGSFVGAARQLRLSATMVSKQVRELEERLGARLLHRTTRRVSLTDVGSMFYERCVRLLAELEELETAATHLQTTPRGVLRVSAPPAFGALRIAALLSEFGASYPEVTVELVLGDRIVDLVEEGFDIAVVIGEVRQASYMTRMLCRAQHVVCAAPSYLEQHGTPVTLDDLLVHNCLDHAFPGATKGWTFIGADGQPLVVRVAGNLSTNSAMALRTAAMGGHGIVLIPGYMVADALRAGGLVRLLTSCETPSLPVRLVYPPGRHLSAKVRAFIDFLVSRLGD